MTRKSIQDTAASRPIEYVGDRRREAGDVGEVEVKIASTPVGDAGEHRRSGSKRKNREKS